MVTPLGNVIPLGSVIDGTVMEETTHDVVAFSHVALACA